MQHEQILKDLETILEGRLPEQPNETFANQTDALKEASDEELEILLADPALHAPENVKVRNEVLGVLNDRLSPERVNQILKEVEIKRVDMFQMTSTQEVLDTDKTAAERARAALSEAGCPLADLIPDEVRHFIIDPDGTFYLELEQPELYHMADFDMVLDQIITGVIEDDTMHSISGLYAQKDINDKTVSIQFLEMFFDGDQITIKTNHPMAQIVHMRREEFMVML